MVSKFKKWFIIMRSGVQFTLSLQRKPSGWNQEGFLFSGPSRTCSCKGMEIKRSMWAKRTRLSYVKHPSLETWGRQAEQFTSRYKDYQIDSHFIRWLSSFGVGMWSRILIKIVQLFTSEFINNSHGIHIVFVYNIASGSIRYQCTHWTMFNVVDK